MRPLIVILAYNANMLCHPGAASALPELERSSGLDWPNRTQAVAKSSATTKLVNSPNTPRVGPPPSCRPGLVSLPASVVYPPASYATPEHMEILPFTNHFSWRADSVYRLCTPSLRLKAPTTSWPTNYIPLWGCLISLLFRRRPRLLLY